jgi:hypothetical protein
VWAGAGDDSGTYDASSDILISSSPGKQVIFQKTAMMFVFYARKCIVAGSRCPMHAHLSRTNQIDDLSDRRFLSEIQAPSS